jgi:hypothetical protein
VAQRQEHLVGADVVRVGVDRAEQLEQRRREARQLAARGCLALAPQPALDAHALAAQRAEGGVAEEQHRVGRGEAHLVLADAARDRAGHAELAVARLHAQVELAARDRLDADPRFQAVPARLDGHVRAPEVLVGPHQRREAAGVGVQAARESAEVGPVLVRGRPGRPRAGLEEVALVEHQRAADRADAGRLQLARDPGEERVHLAVRLRVEERVAAGAHHEVALQHAVRERRRAVEARDEAPVRAQRAQRRGGGEELQVRGRTHRALRVERHQLARAAGLAHVHRDVHVARADLALRALARLLQRLLDRAPDVRLERAVARGRARLGRELVAGSGAGSGTRRRGFAARRGEARLERAPEDEQADAVRQHQQRHSREGGGRSSSFARVHAVSYTSTLVRRIFSKSSLSIVSRQVW